MQHWGRARLSADRRAEGDASGQRQTTDGAVGGEEQSGQKPEGVLADNGYCSDENLKYLAKKRMEGFVAVGKQKHSQR
jgi:hypothetical protein